MSNSNSKTGLPTGSLVLDEEKVNTISRMLKSSDAENYPIAQNLILQVDLTKGINWYYLFKICSEKGYQYTISERMVNRRTKAGREFEKTFNPRFISSLTNCRFLRELDSHKVLDDETMVMMRPLLLDEIDAGFKKLIYPKIVDISISFREEYSQYLPDNEPVKIS